MGGESAATDGDGGIGFVVRIVGATLVAAIAGVRVYAFVHDFWREVRDPAALLATGIATVVLILAVRLLARTLAAEE